MDEKTISDVMSEMAKRSNAKQKANGRNSKHFSDMALKSWEKRRKKKVDNS